MRWLLAAAALSGCGSQAALNAPAFPLYEGGLYEAAADALPPLPEETGKDRLLALYDRGMILHAARRHAASNEALLEAGRLAESIELIQVTERAGTVLTNETFSDYRGEDYERVLCHTLAALNFLSLGDLPAAQVECRRAEEVHRKIRALREGPDRLNAFALYLSGLCYELAGQPNDALIDYRACWELAPDFPPLPDHLLSLTRRLGMAQEHKEWKSRFGRDAAPVPPGTGEVVVLLEAGLAPRKLPGGVLGILPRLERTPALTASGRLFVDGTPAGDTLVLNDVADWAEATHRERETLLLAKRAAILAGKELIAHEVEERHGNFWGWATRFFLYSLEKPDLRHWRTLPASFQACRVRVAAGTRELLLQPVDAAGAPSSEPVLFPAVEVAEGRVVVLIARSVQ